MKMPRYRAVVSAALLAGLTATMGTAKAQRLVDSKDPNLPRVEYADSLISLNDHCIVRGGSLSPAYKAVYVKGKPIGFC